MDNKGILLVLMIVLIVFIVLLAVLGIVFIIALRKRAPVVKVVMAPINRQEEPQPVVAPAASADATTAQEASPESPEAAQEPAVVQEEPESESVEPDDDEDDDSVTVVTEGQERVRYDRSLTAKLCQMKNETKEWYSALKNTLLSYEKVKGRMSWRRETFRIGRMTFARIVVRGKTLCLLLAVEPSGYSGTKYTVEDVSNVANTADTPTLYRIKSARRLKYAQEMIAGIMKELKVYKNTHYSAEDFFLPYQGDMALMQRGLVKRIVSGSTRTFRIEEVDENDLAENDQANSEAAATTQESNNAATAATTDADSGN